MNRLLVLGGSGFVGNRICKIAASRNWSVTSISRSGEPDWSKLGEDWASRPSWSTSVTWERGDALDPSSYKKHLEGKTAVVHSMGVLLEIDYKKALHSPPSFGELLPNPMGAWKPKDPNMTYEKMNRDSAVMLAEAAAESGVKNIVYLSAVDGAFMLPDRYIGTKREAEHKIGDIWEKVEGGRAIFVRPSFVYDRSRPLTMQIARLMGVTSTANSLLRIPLMRKMLGAAGYPPVLVDDVAKAVVLSLEDEGTKGVVGVDEIKSAAEKVWREDMV